MKVAHKVLSRVLVNEFYRANSGFFLFVLLLAFGFLKTPEHVSIAGALATNPIYYLVILGLWTLYALKTLLFVNRIKSLPDHAFLADLVLLPSLQRKLLVVGLQTLLLLPIFGYSLFLIIIAIKAQEPISAAFVFFGNVAMLMVSAHFLHGILIEKRDFKSIRNSGIWVHRLPKGLSTLFIHHLFNRLPLPLLTTKILSIAIIIGASLLFESSENDLRYLTLGVLLAAGIHSALSLQHSTFNRDRLLIFSNLPIPVINKFLTSVTTYGLLFMTEFVVLIGHNFSVSLLPHLAKLIVLAMSLSVFYFSVSSGRTMVMDHFVKYPFFLTVILFFVVLGKVDPLFIAVPLLLVAYGLLLRISLARE